MRISEQEQNFLKQSILSIIPDAKVYLFGSRAKDDEKGGDIDILVIADRCLTLEEKIGIKIDFYKKFGEQKIDIVSFTGESQDNFKKLALDEAIEL